MRLVLTLVIWLMLATSASAQFAGVSTLSPLQTVSGGATDALGNSTVAIDRKGNAVFAWASHDPCSAPCWPGSGGRARIRLRARSSNGVLSDVQTLTPAGVDSFAPSVAIDAAGNAVVMWRETRCYIQNNFGGICYDGKIKARARSARGVLSPVQDISGGPAGFDTATSPAFAVSHSGTAVFAWTSYHGATDGWRIQARARSVEGVLSPVQMLSPPGPEAFFAHIGVDDHGNAVIGWTQSDGTHTRVWARVRSADGALTPVRAISPAGRSAGVPGVAVAVTPRGHAVFVWWQTNHEAPHDARIWSRTRYADGTHSPLTMISSIPVALVPDGIGAFAPKVGVDANGNVVFMWHVEEPANGESRYFIQARGRSISGRLTAVQFVTDSDQSSLIGTVGNGHMAVDATGNAVFTWERYDGHHWRIQTRARSAHGVLSDVQTLSTRATDAFLSEVATNDRGNAVFIWEQSEGSYRTLRTRSRSAP